MNMTETPKDEAAKAKLQLLLFQLSEILNDPPTILDLADWRDNISHVMDQIKEVSELAYNRLEDLVVEVVRRGEVHVDDLDSEAPPNQSERTAHEYFAQVAFVTSEINSLKSI
jgi:hypothetical protein